MKTKCPICGKPMNRNNKVRYWYDVNIQKLVHGCNFCHMNWTTAYKKKISGTEDNGDDIL